MRRITLFIFLLLGGCSKSSDVTPEECFPSVITNFTGRYLVKFDEKTRMVSDVNKEKQVSNITVYEESRIGLGTGSDKISYFVITKDSQGRIISVYDPPFGNQNVLTYNSEGRLATHVFSVKGKVWISKRFIYNDGNLVENIETDDHGQVKHYKYTYDLTKKNYARMAEFVIGPRLSAFPRGSFELGPLLGNRMNNLPVKIQLDSEESPISYEFDAKARPIKYTQIIKSTTVQGIWEYDCP
ncbi:hypothetical protein [Runella aurantiaca]|uniref:DUF4595 domain-containing protein n=1 Tax=Runella aurantiaca TaxID=2282308 RepID=A0A369IKR7_9BACT|nr:hypothetical protein [Runella aurantiaca]RDB07834.1 hypothetical protein DVG78_01915 [Runella aurantiaca]